MGQTAAVVLALVAAASVGVCVGERESRWVKAYDEYELKCGRDAAVVEMGTVMMDAIPAALNVAVAVALCLLVARLDAALNSNEEVVKALRLIARTAKGVTFPPSHMRALKAHAGDPTQAIAKLKKK